MPTTTDRSAAVDFVVRRDALQKTAVVPASLPALADGQVLLKIDAFAFTANNVTYAVIGEMMSYWNFFPAAEGWGRVPVWGFADVVESRHPQVAVGERVYGYFPMSTHLVIEADHVDDAGYVDASAHRRTLPPVYNRYLRTSTDPAYDAKHEDAYMLFRPLFGTSFLLEDFLEEARFHDARVIALASASSKTAIGLAALLAARPKRTYEVVGLTSRANAAFVSGLGYYDRVVPYDGLDALSTDQPLVLVDMAGNAAVRDAVHRRVGDQVRYSCAVGLTHYDAMAPAAPDLPGATPTFFFAPDRVQQRTRDWGGAELQKRIAAALNGFIAGVDRWMRVEHGRGPADVERVYRSMLGGQVDPAVGHILAL
jgi:hypothetical protein